jgi:hypothetical protein
MRLTLRLVITTFNRIRALITGQLVTQDNRLIVTQDNRSIVKQG